MMRTPIKIAVLLALAGGLALSPATLRAEDGKPADTTVANAERANIVMREGLALAEAGNWAEARVKLEEAWSLQQSWDVASNLAFIEEELKDFAAAATHFDFALRAFPASGSPERRAILVERLASTRKEVAEVAITTTVDACAITIDGRAYGTTPIATPVFLAPGDHTIESRKEGYKSEPKRISVTAGEKTTVELPMVREGSTDETGLPKWPGWLIGGVGLVGAGVGIGLIVVGQNHYGDAQDLGDDVRQQGGSCEPVAGPGSEQCSSIVDELDSAGTLTSAGIGVAVAGAVLLIAGIVWVALPDESGASKPVSLAPWIDASPDTFGSAGLVLSGSF